MTPRRRPLSPAAVALGELTAAERREADALLRDDPLFRAEVQRLQATASDLAALELAAWRPDAGGRGRGRAGSGKPAARDAKVV